MGRPSFDSFLNFTRSKVNHVDSTTGFPIHSNIFQEIFDLNKPVIRRGKDFLTKIHKMNLKSDGNLHPTACIVLDVILALESVRCQFGPLQQLKLTFNSASNASIIYKKWLSSSAKFVSGGTEWNCLNETTQKPIIIIQRLILFQLKKKQIIIKTLNDTNLSSLVCFSNIKMSLTLEQSSSKTPTISRNKRAVVTVPGASVSSTSWSFIPLTPHGNEIFYPGEMINIRWSYSNIDEMTDLKITLNRKRTMWLDIEIDKMKTYINVQQITYIIPPSLETSSHYQYYLQFSFTRKLLSYERESATFHISTRPSIILRSSPTLNDVYYPGDLVPIIWESHNFDFSTTITVRFRRVRLSVIIDAILDTFTVSAIANGYNYTIFSSLDRTDNDKYYYFEFDYCTSWLSLNCKQSTNNFFIPTRPYLHPTFPSVDEWFFPSQLLILTWTTANFDNLNDLLKIKLRRYNYFLPDSDIDLFQCRIDSSGMCTYTLSSVPASFSDYYFEYDWCKYWYSRQCTTKTNRFSISTQTIGSWNYDMNHAEAFHPQKLYSNTCDSLCPTKDSQQDYICRMCDEGRSLGIDLTCINCWAAYDYSLIQIDLVHKDNSLILDYLTVRISSSILVNMDFSIIANYSSIFSGNLSFPSIPIINSIPFTIGNIPFDIGLSFSVSIPWHIEVNTINNLTVGVDYKLETNLTLISREGSTTKKYNQTLLRNNHPIEGDFQDKIKIDLALRPALQLDIGIFTLEIATEGYLIFENLWRYPPFDSLSTLNFNWNNEKPSQFHLSIPSNACIYPHFIRYHIIFGIRRTEIKFFVSMKSLLNELFNNVTLSYSTPSILDLGPYELVAGCMFIAHQNTDIPKTIYLVFNRKFNQTIDPTNNYLSKTILFDLSYALNVSQTRLYCNRIYSVQHDTMTGVMITLLPASSPYTIDETVVKLLEKLENQQINTSSALYSGIIIHLLNLQQTLSANTLGSSVNNRPM
ncbi:unnamed protein product [Adineta steineri]|uniref:Uncharacterized protein n=1 Tax=Adineta steineri TaxID=433720 RepID=A0A814FCC0_9BILA|nr:unnamed protein product [Adineta steineri]CAF1050820.1 unnamed protein product [Adineta steineri]